MKRNIILAVAFLIIACSFTSCENISDCKVCKIVSTDSSTGDVNESGETQYCGNELLAIEAKPPTTIGTITNEWHCR